MGRRQKTAYTPVLLSSRQQSGLGHVRSPDKNTSRLVSLSSSSGLAKEAPAQNHHPSGQLKGKTVPLGVEQV